MPRAEAPVRRARPAAGPRFGVPVARRTRVARVIGHDRVEAVEIEHLRHRARTRVVAATRGRSDGRLDPRPRAGPPRRARPGSRTTRAARGRGPAHERAGRVRRGQRRAPGRHRRRRRARRPARRRSRAALARRRPGAAAGRATGRGGAVPRGSRPGCVRPGDRRRRAAAAAVGDERRALPRVVVEQDGPVLSRRRLPWPLAPGRVFRVPWSMASGARVDAGDVTIRLG